MFIIVLPENILPNKKLFWKASQLYDNIQQMLLTRIQKFTSENVHIVTCGSFEILIISICEIHMFTVCTHFVQCIKNVQS